MAPAKVFVSAGESSGDLYAAALVAALSRSWPETDWFGCTGPRMRRNGIRTLLDASELSVVGLVEVVRHLPRIYRHYRVLTGNVARERPDLAILTDSPDFHLRVAARLNRLGIPVIYLVAPQAWAWRRGRVRQMRRNLARLLCLFPFEEPFFRRHGINAHYIGHPLAPTIRPSMSRAEFFECHGIPPGRPLVTLCPGSRKGEMERHLPIVLDAVGRIAASRPCSFVLAIPPGFREQAGETFFRERISSAPIQVIEGKTWDALSHADITLAASGTVTMEAALLGTPLVTYYKVAAISWWLGGFLVQTPYYSMVNLLAGKPLAPELMQNQMTGESLAREALRLLDDETARCRMRQELAEVAASLRTGEDPMERAARITKEFFDEYRS